jgi:hypothetical protein
MPDPGPIGARDGAFPGASLARSDVVILFLQEMLIDVFGIIIPGFCCIVLVTAALVFPLLDLARILQSLQHLTDLRNFISSNSTAILLTTLPFSFLIGHLLYRQDPKRPDSRSISKCWTDIFDNAVPLRLSEKLSGRARLSPPRQLRHVDRRRFLPGEGGR